MCDFKCPHCEKVTDFWGPNDPKDFFWCNFCGELSIYEKRALPLRELENEFYLRKPTEIEYEAIYSGNTEDKRLNSKLWLPSISKDKLSFEVMIIKDGVLNDHKLSNLYDFMETERYLKLIFHKMGVMPMVGDYIKGRRTEKNEKGINENHDFVIIGRQMGNDGYEDMLLFVVFESEWIKKQGY